MGESRLLLSHIVPVSFAAKTYIITALGPVCPTAAHRHHEELAASAFFVLRFIATSAATSVPQFVRPTAAALLPATAFNLSTISKQDLAANVVGLALT